MKYIEIKKMAEKVVEELKPYCTRIEIAGSIRRKCIECNDIEIVAIPDSYKLEQYFIVNKRKFNFIKNGSKYKQYLLQGIVKVDLFLATKNNWGMIYAMRTGSANFSYFLAKKWAEKGYSSREGILYNINYGGKVYIREEKELFVFLNLEWVEPEKRV